MILITEINYPLKVKIWSLHKSQEAHQAGKQLQFL